MLLITLVILLCQYTGVSQSTRLPLEIYELTPAAAAAGVAGVGVAGVESAEPTDLRHKRLEYDTINAARATVVVDEETATTDHRRDRVAEPEAEAVATASASSSVPGSHNRHTNIQLDRRRSRQMLDMLHQHQHQREHQQQPKQQKHSQQHPHREGGGLHLLQIHTSNDQQHHKQHFGHQAASASASASASVVTISSSADAKDVRILYQVGDSEDDLPVCAPNAVCSKIDLYETPWIERQCRCPSASRLPDIVIHHHHRDNALLLAQHSARQADEYHNYYEQAKLVQQQHKHLLAGDYGDRKFENLHLKKLMQKLGSVYAEDLHLPNDYLMHDDDNAALPTSVDTLYTDNDDDDDVDQLGANEFPRATLRRHIHAGVGGGVGAHMRHSGHHVATAIPSIGGCPSGLGVEDGHTIADKTRHYKLCQPVHKLPVCRHFRDYTWTLTTAAEMNSTEQIVHCRCPRNSVTYLTKREPTEDGSAGYRYLFACSPLTRLRCQRKQPCKLFTVRKRQEFLDEVNINALCQCPKGHHCPSHHTQSGVISGESFLEDNIQTYSGYCMAND